MTSTPQICVIDDAADYRFVLQQVFSRFLPTYSVALYADGNRFLDALSELSQLPNLILLDRHMPGLDGHQLLLHLKRHPLYKRIPVVMMSGDASGLEVNDCYEACANSFLHKAVGFDSLREQLALVCQYWVAMNRQPMALA